MLGEEGIVKNYLREVDWIQGSMYSATEIYSIVDKWNALHNCCMDSTTLNKIKSKFTYSWNLKHKVMCVMIVIIGYGKRLCLIMPSMSSALMASVNSVQQTEKNLTKMCITIIIMTVTKRYHFPSVVLAAVSSR